MGLRQFQSVPRIHILNRPQNFNFQNPLEFTHFLSSEMHRALENEGRSTFRQVVFSGCLEENSEGLQRGLRSRSA